jgi:excinuclease ABC subunit B
VDNQLSWAVEQGRIVSPKGGADTGTFDDPAAAHKEIRRLEREMRAAASELEFERAADLRDRIAGIRTQLLNLG